MSGAPTFSTVLLLSLPVLIFGQCSNDAVYDSAANRCLQFYRVALDFQTSEAICAASSGHLVSVHNTISNNFLASQAQKYFADSAWLGAKSTAPDVTNPLNWYWTDGTSFNYQAYKIGQPTSQGDTSCMQFQVSTTKWLTAPCNATAPFICQFSVQLTPTCPAPIIPSHCPSGYAWFDETDFCYKSFVRSSNFNDARSVCQADGGELASIHSQTENDFLVEMSKAGITNKDKGWNDDVWIGLVYQQQKWQWTDGSDVNYVNWGDGEPNNMDKEWWTTLVADPHESKNSEGQRWNNVAQIDERAFVCKRAPLH